MAKDVEILKALNTKLNRTRITIINDFPFLLPTKKGEMWPQTGYGDVSSLQIDPMNKIYVIDPKGIIGIVDDINLDNEIRVKTLSSGFESAMADVMHSANIIIPIGIINPTPADQYYKFAEIEMPQYSGGSLSFKMQWDEPNLGVVTCKIVVHNRGHAPDNIITDYHHDISSSILNNTGVDNSHISLKINILVRFVEYPTPQRGVVGKCELYFHEKASDYSSGEYQSGRPNGAVFIYGVDIHSLYDERGEKLLPTFFSEQAFITELPEGISMGENINYINNGMMWRYMLNNQTYNNPTLNHPTLIGDATAPGILGLGDRSDRIATTKFTHDAMSVALKEFVQKDGLKGLSDRNYTAEEQTKLAGIAEGADVSPISSDVPNDSKTYGRVLGAWVEVSGVSDYDDLENRPIIKVDETLPDPENSIVKEDTLYQVGDRFYIYKTGNVYPENSVLPSPYPTGWTDEQTTVEGNTMNYICCNLSSLMKIPTPAADVIYVKVKINGNEQTITLNYLAEGGSNIYLTEQGTFMLGNDKIFDAVNLTWSDQIGSSFFVYIYQEAISSFEVLSISRNLTDESGFAEKHFVTDEQLERIDNCLLQDKTTGEGIKIYSVDNDGNQTMLSIDDLKTLLGIS